MVGDRYEIKFINIWIFDAVLHFMQFCLVTGIPHGLLKDAYGAVVAVVPPESVPMLPPPPPPV